MGNNEKASIEIVELIIETLGKSEDLIKYVKDRLGHDRRYAAEWIEKIVSGDYMEYYNKMYLAIVN